MQTVANFNFAGKKALVRVDFNVPLNDRFEITDDTRIKATIPTIQKILKDGNRSKDCIIQTNLTKPLHQFYLLMIKGKHLKKGHC